jgi:hypothetical protein
MGMAGCGRERDEEEAICQPHYCTEHFNSSMQTCAAHRRRGDEEELGCRTQSSSNRHGRLLRGFILVLSVVLLSILVLHSRQTASGWGKGPKGTLEGETMPTSRRLENSPGVDSGHVRCVVSLAARNGLWDAGLQNKVTASNLPGTAFAIDLERIVASTISPEAQVRIDKSMSKDQTTLDISVQVQVPSSLGTRAKVARLLRQKVDDGSLNEALVQAGLAFTAAWRSKPHPFSATGLPDTFPADDTADTALICGMVVSVLTLLPALVLAIFHFQVIERFVRPPPPPPLSLPIHPSQSQSLQPTAFR